ncbi:MAG: hypothetical protein BZ151_09915 [Desulfobacca sp. 4484_104]|nr:MAG: hypothetical protein BZ151_09915 [Desulfobacca sp. 4484_104]
MTKVLSQDEVDALLKGMMEGEVDTETDEPSDEDIGIISYDFTSQERIIRGRMPTLEVINEHFHIYKMEPLRGQCVLVVDSKLVFSFVECFLGGTAKRAFKIEGRDFTAVERQLIQKVVLMAFTDLEKAWAPVQQVNLVHVRSEINPMFVGVATPNDIVVVTRLKVELDQTEGAIIICIPYSTIEPIKGKLYSGFQSEQLGADSRWTERIKDQLQDLAVNVIVPLGTTTLTARRLLDLKPGDIILLDKKVTDPICAQVEGVNKFIGSAGLSNQSKAFKVNNLLYPQ